MEILSAPSHTKYSAENIYLANKYIGICQWS